MVTRDTKLGQVTGAVKWMLRAEGLAIALAAVWLYAHVELSWGLFAVFFLVPDLAFFGYLINNKTGAIAYNFAHSLMGAIFMAGIGFVAELPAFQLAGLIWVAHIGFDRAMGYGLKYQKGFGYTHLGLIGAAKINSK